MKYMKCPLHIISDWQLAEANGRIKMLVDEDGRPHCEDGPAVTDLLYPDDSGLWMLHGKIHRIGGPAYSPTCLPRNKKKYKIWAIDGVRIKNWMHYQTMSGCSDEDIEALGGVPGVAYGKTLGRASPQGGSRRKKESRLFEFRFNLKRYPDLFDLHRIELLGMVSKINPHGLTRDHMVSVADAVKHDYDPRYIRHPLNCEFLTQVENVAKGSESSMIYGELVMKVWAYDTFGVLI